MEITITITTSDNLDREGAEELRDALVSVAELTNWSAVEVLVTSKIED